MIRFELTKSKRYIEIKGYDSDRELVVLNDYFKRMNRQAYASWEFRQGIWDGMDHFIHSARYIPSGLWNEIYKMSEERGIQCEVIGLERIYGKEFDDAELDAFIDSALDQTDITELRPFQREAFKKSLKYKYCTLEISTAAGKTIICYLLAAFLKSKGLIDKDNKLLLITNRVQLVKQTNDKFDVDYNNGKIPMKVLKVGGKRNAFKQKTYDEAEVVIISHQSLVKRDKEFYKSVRHVIVDEAHASKGKTIPNAILSCEELFLRVGVSGTIKISPKYSDFFRIQQHLGPLVMRYFSKQLIEDGFAPKVKIRIIKLGYKNVMTKEIQDYLSLLKNGKAMYKDVIEFGKAMYAMETSLIRANVHRLRFIANLIKSLGKNSLVLFNDVQGGYGKTICKMVSSEGVHSRYVDGPVDVDLREQYKAEMEQSSNMCLVASYGTFSTGIDIKNVNYIILAESYKAEILIRQTIGRSMRLFEGKNEVYIIDLVDTFGKYGKEHARDRLTIYNAQGFPHESYEKQLVKVLTD